MGRQGAVEPQGRLEVRTSVLPGLPCLTYFLFMSELWLYDEKSWPATVPSF